MELICPVCQQPTDRLKQFRYFRWLLFVLIGAYWQHETLRGCPSCLRRAVWRRCLFNIVPANLLWPLFFLPWAIGLTIASRRPGHSQAILDQIEYERKMPRTDLFSGIVVRQQLIVHEEMSWARVLAIVSCLTFYFPLLGLLVSGLAWFVTRRETNWTRIVCKVTFLLSALLHLGLLIFMIVLGALQ